MCAANGTHAYLMERRRLEDSVEWDSLVVYYLLDLNSCPFWMLTSSQPFPTVHQAVPIYGVVFFFFPKSVIYLNRYIMTCTVCGLSSHLWKWAFAPNASHEKANRCFVFVWNHTIPFNKQGSSWGLGCRNDPLFSSPAEPGSWQLWLCFYDASFEWMWRGSSWFCFNLSL